MSADLPPYRPCDICGGVDQDPRHTFAGVIADEHPVNEDVRQALLDNLDSIKGLKASDAALVVAAFNDTASTDRHIDCCAEAGCPLAGTEHGCDRRVEAANGKTGEGMRKAALSLNKDK